MSATGDAKLRLRVVTNESVKYDEDTDMVILRCVTGDMGILSGHEACSAILDDGVLRIIKDGEESAMAVFGGIAQVLDNTVTILTNDAQWPDEIDQERVSAEREDAQSRLRENADNVQIQKDQVVMRRTLVQIEVSAYPLINRK